MHSRKLLSTTVFRLRRLMRRMWVRTTGFALLAVLAAGFSRVAAPYLPRPLTGLIEVEAVVDLLTILSSSMLAVTTFSLGVIMSVRLSIISTITPRAHSTVADDVVTQQVLATFLGAFVYALTAQVLLRTGLYDRGASTVILIVTVFVLMLVIIAMLRWIETLTSVGSIPATVDEITEAMADAVADWHARPALGATPAPRAAPPPDAASGSVIAETDGYIQHVDIGALNAAAEAAEDNAEVYVTAAPGAFVVAGDTLCRYSGDIDPEEIATAFTIDRTRNYDQDLRHGIIVLSEIAQRALSPAVNDPGTAIFITDRITALLSGKGRKTEPGAPTCPRVHLAPVTSRDLLTDGLDPIARDGADKVEVQVRLQRGFARLARHGDVAMAAAAHDAARRAGDLAEAELVLESDRRRIRALVEAVLAEGPAPSAV